MAELIICHKNIYINELYRFIIGSLQDHKSVYYLHIIYHSKTKINVYIIYSKRFFIEIIDAFLEC